MTEENKTATDPSVPHQTMTPTQPHPWRDAGTEDVSAKIAGPHLMAFLLELGVGAKTAATCVWAVCAELEDKGCP